jgi:hypothetical protein
MPSLSMKVFVEVDSGYLGDNRFMQPQHASLKQAKIENKKGVVRG